MRRSNLFFLICVAWLAAGCASAVGDGSAPSPFRLSVSPASAAIPGTATMQFAAVTTDGSLPAITWSVDGVAGGGPLTGTISATGLFTAPEFPPTPNTLTIQAVETHNSKWSGSSLVTLQNPVPLVSTVSPMSIPVGPFTLTISGAHFADGATVNFGSTVLATTKISSTQLTATGTATTNEVGNVAITVSNPTPGNAISGAVTAQVRGSKLSVAIRPMTGSVRAGATQQFAATVTGSSNTGVSWSVNGIPGGNATLGTIVGNGLYSAPAAVPAANAITVTATSVADSTQSANSAISLLNPLPVISTVSPAALTVGAFTIKVTGTGFVNGAVVYFGTTALATTYVSPTQLTATGTAAANQAGNVPVTVKNPDPGAAVSGAIDAVVTVPNTSISVSVAPPTTTLRAGATQTFTAKVAGTTNTAVTWAVDGVLGGYAAIGTIDVNGNYQAPDNLPSPNPVTVTAISSADTTKTGNSSVSIQNPIPVLASASPGTIGTGAFEVSLNGSGFVNTSSVSFGGIPVTVTYASPTLITVVGTVPATGDLTVTVSNPNPGAGTTSAITVHVVGGGNPVSAASAARFLEQGSFGPNTESLNQVQTMGFDFYLQNQFAAPPTAYRNPTENYQIYSIQSEFFLHEISMGDQLRGRTSLALNELWVVGADKISDPLGYTNYLRTLDQDAFGNYLTIMKDITLTPAMGHYLDMVNNDKPAVGQHANENYAREIMQLFTLGLNQLNIDGTPVLDTSGNPVPTYTQNDVMALGLAFTGWTYPTKPGAIQQTHNPSYYGGPMVSSDANHDMEAKTLLGQAIPAGQGAQADLDAALGIIFNHPNVGPFVAKQLIVHLVSSNPTPAYVQRVATAFNSGTFVNAAITYGGGTRGDIQATIAAVLLDPEARQGDSATTAVASDGKLREPVIMEASIARAFHAKTDAGGFSNAGERMEQNIFYPPTVFNFFPPVYAIQGSTLNGPEFAIFDTVSSIERVNFINDAVYGAIGSNTHLDFSPVVNAGTPDQMLAWLNTLFLHGALPAQMNTTILAAMNAVAPTDTKGQAQAAIYLVTSSSMYQVQH